MIKHHKPHRFWRVRYGESFALHDSREFGSRDEAAAFYFEQQGREFLVFETVVASKPKRPRVMSRRTTC